MRPIFGLLFGLLLAVAARAEDDYPSRPIRIIVPYPPGGVTDLVGRIVASGLSEKLNQTVVVENKAGANGIVGSSAFLHTKADGYTLLIGGFGSHLIPPLVNSNYPFKTDDFALLATFAEFANVMSVSAELPVKNVQDFIAYAKANPGKLNFGSTGIGASDYMTAELFMQATGTKMVNVPYKGGPEALQGLQSGQVHVAFENMPPSLGLVKAGAVKALAVTSEHRLEQLPDVPTMIESGVPDFRVTSWVGVFGLPSMPQDVVRKLDQAMTELGKDPAVVDRFKKIGFEMAYRNLDQSKTFLQGEIDRWRKVVDVANIRIK
ncbi:MAG: tripartite tricarboxylate transporter substrate binding protein [Proteobacteria bacterium]|nr:tripartite tricarboxylate transporter substrate binding protein [Pseudomonadota bacterium]